MARQRPGLPEQLVDLTFPVQGLDLTTEFELQRPGTTDTAMNVRGYESLTQRQRGGSRPGLAQYIAQQVSGPNLIQHLNYIVDPQADALSTAFDPLDTPIVPLGLGWGFGPGPFIDYGFPTIVPGTPNPANQPGQGGVLMPNGFWTRTGGSGLQPNALVGTSPRDTFTGTIVAGKTSLPNDGTTTTVTVTILKGVTPVSGSNVVLSTSPSGRVGDGATSSTNGSGQVVFTVSDMNREVVTYSARDTTDSFTVPTTVMIHYGGIEFDAFIDSDLRNGQGSFTTFLAAGDPVTAGDVVLLAVAAASLTAVPTIAVPGPDSQGNIYTLLATGTNGNLRMSVFWTIASSSGFVDVTYSISGGGSGDQNDYLYWAYSFADPVAPVDAFVVNEASGAATFTTTTIPVHNPNSAAIALFSSDPSKVNPFPAVTPGWTQELFSVFPSGSGSSGAYLFVNDALHANSDTIGLCPASSDSPAYVAIGISLKPA